MASWGVPMGYRPIVLDVLVEQMYDNFQVNEPPPRGYAEWLRGEVALLAEETRLQAAVMDRVFAEWPVLTGAEREGV